MFHLVLCCSPGNSANSIVTRNDEKRRAGVTDVCSFQSCGIRINLLYSTLRYQKEKHTTRNPNRKSFFLVLLLQASLPSLFAVIIFLYFFKIYFLLFANVSYFKLLRTSTLPIRGFPYLVIFINWITTWKVRRNSFFFISQQFFVKFWEPRISNSSIRP